jgi:hypothetical protein
MKNVKTFSTGILLALLFVSTAAAVVTRADDANDIRDARVVSARAGRVNFVSGDVRLRRSGSLEWRALTADDELKSGDTVGAGAGGRVEVLLNPGSYFRAGAGAEFTLAEAELDDLRVELGRGSAVVEATGYGDLDLSITIATPRTTVRIIRSGIYRVNALADGAAEVAVFDGRALVGETLVKGGRVARAGGAEVAKLDKKNRDDLDLWSRDRGKELAKANEKLQRRSLNTFFAQNGLDSIYSPYGRSRGFWFFNDRMRCYTFVPFYADWRSPYGYWYGTGVMVNYPSYPSRWPGGTYPNPSDGGGGTIQPPRTGGSSPGGGPGQGGMAPSRPGSHDTGGRVPAAPRPERAAPEGRPRSDQR